MFRLLLITCLATSAIAEWTTLRVKWGVPLPGDNTVFQDQPRTLGEATDQGWSQLESINACDDAENGDFYGTRWLKDGDRSIILLMDANGYIAGMQQSISPSSDNIYNFDASEYYVTEEIQGTRWYTQTAYFVDIARICAGRTEAEFIAEGTGTDLRVYNKGGLFQIPNREADINSTGFTRGHCFVSMGNHYWFNVSLGMDCQDFKPIFLLYNSGELKAFGWAAFGYYDGDHYEHPGVDVIGQFIDPVPDCLPGFATEIGGFTTQHIYLRSQLEAFC